MVKAKFGSWILINYLGGGGNGDVWLCTNGTDTRAIKLLKRINAKSLQRFTDETSILEKNRDLEGVIPIIEKNLSTKNNTPYYLMPIAKPSTKILYDRPIKFIIEQILDLSKSLEFLHNRQIYHRDIKPSNILYLNDKICFSDFGLVDYPDKLDISNHNEEIGAKWTIAPEMRRESSNADYAKADIYSLAKTLWIFLSKIPNGFDGQYSTDTIISLKNKFKTSYTSPIDDLLIKSTDNDANKRPDIRKFIENLEEWLELNDKFHKRNMAQWFEIQTKLFPTSFPTTVKWSKCTEIIKVLNTICLYENLNHMFLPQGGGMDLCSAKLSLEPDCIELNFSFKEIVKPKELVFESFGKEHYWNYFRLELQELKDSGVYSASENDQPYNTFMNFEKVSELLPGKYFHSDILEKPSKFSNKYYISDKARLIVRRFRGVFVIFNKASIYNRISSTYDARHNNMSSSEFRKYIEALINHTSFKEDISESDKIDKNENLPIELTKQEIYRCGNCGNFVASDGSKLNSY
ncbi:MAG: protein kinase [Saprospiraceae bacterium]